MNIYNLSTEDILKEKRQIKDWPIVYFLLDNDTIVYVGKSLNGMVRIYDHIKNSNYGFNAYAFFNVPKEQIDKLERRYIKRFSPKYNKMHNDNLPEKKYMISEDNSVIVRKRVPYTKYSYNNGTLYKKPKYGSPAFFREIAKAWSK